MSNNQKRIIISSVIAIIVITLLFFAIPITGTFITSYIFALLAICGIALSLWVFGKGNNKSPQSFAYVRTALVYGMISTIVSIILCVLVYFTNLHTAVTVVIHSVIFAVFAIRAIAVSSGNEYIVKVDEKAEEKHEAFEKTKKTYWK